MSSRVRKLTDKGLELLARNLRGKCASGLRSANAVVNKLVLLIKDNTSDAELVKQYITELEKHISAIVASHLEFNNKFAGDLDTLADFHQWFHPRFETLQSVLQYSQNWVANVHFQEIDYKDMSVLNVPEYMDDILPEDSASQVSRHPESGCSKDSRKTSCSRGS